MKRFFTHHGLERYRQRVGYLRYQQCLRHINSLPPGDRVVSKGFVYVFAPDAERPDIQRLITVFWDKCGAEAD